MNINPSIAIANPRIQTVAATPAWSGLRAAHSAWVRTTITSRRSRHRVTVDGFWIDRTPITNAAFRAFVARRAMSRWRRRRPTRKITLARCRVLKAASAMLSASQTRRRSGAVGRLVDFQAGRELATSLRRRFVHCRDRRSSGGPHRVRGRRKPMPSWAGKESADRSRVGICRARRSRRRGVCVGRRVCAAAAGMLANYLAGLISEAEPLLKTARSARLP